MNAGNFAITQTLELDNPIKEWNSAQDTRTRTWHINMDGKTKPVDEDFIVVTPTKTGDVKFRMKFTGDVNGGASNVCNCRCFTLYYDSADEITE